MTLLRRTHGRVVLLGILCLAAIATGALGQGPSVPAPAYPALPDADAVAVHVADLEEAPPAAQEAIVQLVQLGAYPLTPAMEALPNAPLDAATAAYLLVNLFLPEAAEQFPAPSADALIVLEVATGEALPPDAVLTVGATVALLPDVLSLSTEEADALRAALNARYPALRAGNPEAPLTRAGGALLLVMALEHLTRP